MDRSSDAANGQAMSFSEWLATPLGAYLGQREQAYFDRTVADIFGFHALQIGLPECPLLEQSRIVSKWILDYDPPADIIADPHGLPFAENTIDLIVMPHALEFTDDPHLMLREAWRVIRPEGQIVISGFNPFSLFGTRRYFGRGATPPWNGNFIALYRLKTSSAASSTATSRRLRRTSGCGAFHSSRRPAIAGGRSPAAFTFCVRRRRCLACACSRRRGSVASAGKKRWRRRRVRVRARA